LSLLAQTLNPEVGSKKSLLLKTDSIYGKTSNFKSLEYINNFLTVCVTLGVPNSDLFNIADLSELKNPNNVITCLRSLGIVMKGIIIDRPKSARLSFQPDELQLNSDSLPVSIPRKLRKSINNDSGAFQSPPLPRGVSTPTLPQTSDDGNVGLTSSQESAKLSSIKSSNFSTSLPGSEFSLMVSRGKTSNSRNFTKYTHINRR